MSRRRRKYPAELKAKAALEALREEATMTELAARYDVQPNLIAKWKRKAREQVLLRAGSGRPRHHLPDPVRQRALHERVLAARRVTAR